jgi:ubiquinone/menaquinone biosynthesis C-methylase UbiE
VAGTEFAAAFSGSVPEAYDRLLVPLIFQHYAEDMATRATQRAPRRVLELAAGTGAVTRCLARALPPATSIVATDLNQGMLDRAAALGTERPVDWRQADAQALPFPDGSFDLVACQFGVMFFPDKAGAFAQALRVLAPGGLLLFNTWDSLAANELAATVDAALAALFPDNPPHFMAEVPHGYHDRERIAADLRRGGFSADPLFTTLPGRSEAGSAQTAAQAFCQGTPLRAQIEARRPGGLDAVTAACAAAISARFGTGPVGGAMQAQVIAVAA